jgi:general secretion pathway protein M
MNANLEMLKAWWNGHQPRERLILGAGGMMLVIALFFLAVWEPLHQARQRGELALEQSRKMATRLEAIASEVERARGAGGAAAANRSLSLLAAVDKASKLPDLGKAPSRIQPEGEKEVKVWFDEVPFDALMQWMQVLQTQYGLNVSAAEIERKNEGLVSVRLSLVRP